LIGFFVRLFLSLFLDKEGRQALARRAQVSSLEDELKIEMAKTNALISAINKQGKQQLGISDARRAEIDTALLSQAKSQEALSELDPDTRRLMIERALSDQQAAQPQPPAPAAPLEGEVLPPSDETAKEGERP